MFYNLLNFPGTNPDRLDELKIILDHVEPDLLAVNELKDVDGANDILASALSSKYKRAIFTNGTDTDNMLFYNKEKVILHSQEEIYTSLRIINHYKVFLNDPNLATTNDTVFLNLYSLHLKAGNTSDNEKTRLGEVDDLMDYIDNQTNGENILIGGDFNFYSGNEPAYTFLTDSGNTTIYDPLNSPNDWNNNSSYSNLHTQSTRTTSLGDGGSTGGMDDRFDIIFSTGDILYTDNDLNYIVNSYQPIGNDGNIFNGSVTGTSAVPSNVADALHVMSDHIPIYMEIETAKNLTGFKSFPTFQEAFEIYYTINNNQIQLNFNSIENKTIITNILSINGSLIKSQTNNIQSGYSNTTLTLPENAQSGLYLMNITDGQESWSKKFTYFHN
ncbi:MAG: endonuclease/exonuclease/phosphatase family protein [Bacteroidia bacterium]|nr:endonuclease/exonuclease/phosphatase family protein [Bacteroidia bacterium]